ncbi:MAG: hypothetical protein J6Y78_01550 [Paludibacteraceae bacterium]|nr:hypothetical protein [Paludibacteraceae bacterium]
MNKFANILFISIILLCAFTGCNSLDDKNIDRNIKESKLLAMWRVDTFGCMKYRTADNAIYIRDSLNLTGKSTAFVIDELGVPNSRQTNDDRETLIYYFNTYCNDNVFIDSVDYCWLELLIESDKVKNIYTKCY